MHFNLLYNTPSACKNTAGTKFKQYSMQYNLYIQSGSVFKSQDQLTPPKRYWHYGYKNVPNRIHVHLGQLSVQRQ